MRTVARITAIMLINIVIIALLLEVLLRVFVGVLPPPLAIPVRWVTTGDPYADDWTPAWQQNRDHYYALRPDVTDELQYGSPQVQFRLTTTELWDNAGIGFRTDPVDYRVDAVVVGDSFGFCFTEREDCWVEQFAASSGLGTVNLSMPVTGTTSHYRILRDFGQPLEPPLVIWQFFGNDFNDDYGLAVFRDEISEIQSDPLPAPETHWLQRNSALVAVLQTLQSGNFIGFDETAVIFNKPYRLTYGDTNQHELIFGSLYEQQAMDMTREENQIGYDLSQKSFREAAELVDVWAGEMVVVIIPTREEVYQHLTREALGDEALARLESAREAMQTLCDDFSLLMTCYDAIDVLTESARQGEALYHADDMHLNPFGNQVLAEWLASQLIQDNFLPLRN